MKDLLHRMLQGMKDRDLAAFEALIHKEQARRATKRINEGRFSEPTEDELDLFEKNCVDGTLAYAKRTKCPMMMARMVMEHCLNSEEEVVEAVEPAPSEPVEETTEASPS